MGERVNGCLLEFLVPLGIELERLERERHNTTIPSNVHRYPHYLHLNLYFFLWMEMEREVHSRLLPIEYCQN